MRTIDAHIDYSFTQLEYDELQERFERLDREQEEWDEKERERIRKVHDHTWAGGFP